MCEQGAEEKFRPERDKIIGGLRKQHNDELHNFTAHQV